MIGAIVAASLTLYLGLYLWVGWRYVGPRYVLRQVSENIRRYPTIAKDPVEVARWRKGASAEAWGPAVVWPFCLLTWLLAGRLAVRAPLTDHEARQKERAQAARIADLERQLGIRP